MAEKANPTQATAGVSYKLSASKLTVADLPGAPEWARKPTRNAAIVIRKRR